MTKRAIVAVTVCLAVLQVAAIAEDHGSPAGVTPEAARTMLKDGNKRYATSAVRPRRYRSERPGLAGGQHPYAMVLSCADSRVPPEIVFDESLGKLFVVRVAGNVAHGDELASLEYAAAHLGARFLLVLGHSSCGAVKAATGPEDETPNLAGLLKDIRPAVDVAKVPGSDPSSAAFLSQAVKENVRLQVRSVTERSELLKKLVAEGKVTVAGAVYDLASGKVEWLDSGVEPPKS